MKTFANGLSIILPTAIIVYLLLWVLEKKLKQFLKL